ncbi:MAG: hypothetical protein WC966_04275 [Bradymonadales bacterium]|jgi:hypothetical protein
MSGFELDSDLLLGGLSQAKEIPAKLVDNDASQELLARLQRSTDISADLSALLLDRPYVYARVMQQLGSVVGSGRLRRIHSQVVARSQNRPKEAVLETKPKVLRKKDSSATASSNPTTGSSGADLDDAAKEVNKKKFRINLPGSAGADVEVEMKDGTATLDLSTINVPYLTGLRGSAQIAGTSIKSAQLEASFTAKYFKQASVTIALRPDGDGLNPVGNLNAQLDIPGMEETNCALEVQSDSVKGSISTGKIFGNVALSGSLSVSVAESTDISGSMSASYGAEGGFNVSGDINFALQDGALDGAITGELNVSGFKALMGENPVKLKVAYDGSSFSAELGGPASFQHNIGENVEVSYEVASASYTTAELFSCEGSFSAKLGEHVTISGDANVVSNALSAANLTVESNDFKLPAESPIISGSLKGSTGLDEQGFIGAELEGELKLKIGSNSVALAINQLALSREGTLNGDLSLAEPLDLKILTVNTFNAKFDSITGINSLDGSGTLQLNNIRSKEEGIKISYEQGAGVKADGLLQLHKNSGEEIAESSFNIDIGETLSGEGKFTFTNDVAFPDESSQLKIKKDSTVDVSIVEGALQNVPFKGSFSYGEDLEADGTLRFSGNFDGTLNVETSTVDLTGTAGLTSDCVVQHGPHSMTLLGGAKRSTDLNVTVKASKLTQVTGSVNYKANILFSQDELVLDGKLNNFVYEVEGNKFSGKAVTKLQRDFDVNDSLRLKNTSVIEVDVANSEVQTVKGNLKAEAYVQSKYIQGGKGTFDLKAMGAVLDVDAGELSCPAVSVEVKKALTLETLDKKSKLTLAKGAGAKGVIENNKLTSFDVLADYSGSTKIFGEQRELQISGKFDMQVTNADTDAQIKGKFNAKLDEDMILDKINGFDEFTLKVGTDVKLDFDQDSVNEVEGNFIVGYMLEPTELLKSGIHAELRGEGIKYKVAEKSLSGSATLILTEDLKFGTEQNNFTASAKSNISAEIDSNKLSKLSGTLDFSGDLGIAGSTLHLSEGKLNLNAVDPKDLGTLDGDVSFKLDGNFDLGGFKVILSNTDVSGEFKESKLISAKMKAGAEIETSLNGNQVKFEVKSELAWAEEAGVSGDIEVSCKDKTKLGALASNRFDYGLAGVGEKEAANVTITVLENNISRVKGHAGIYLEELGGKEDSLLKVNGNIEFDYDVSGNNLVHASGTVSVEEKRLSPAGGEELWIASGTEATLTIANNDLEGISGTVKLELRDEEGAYLAFLSEGDFKILEESSVSGDVSATVIRDKRILGNEGGLSFWICADASAISASIVDNAVKKIDGSFSFKVQNKGTDFFGGNVTGNYAESKLNASGEVTMLSDYDFPPTAPIFRVVKGSGGSASVKDNELEKIGGNLVVQISAPKSAAFDPAVEISANGDVTFSEDEPKVNLSGTVTVLKEIELVKGLSITELSASGSIVDNELEKISGSAEMKYTRGSLTLTGKADTFAWEKPKGGGEDQFEFTGSLVLDAFDGKLHGEVEASYKTGTPPVIKGKVQFTITEYLKGEIDVEFKEDWTPVISGTMECTDVELIAGHKLIGFDKQFGVKIPVYGPVSIDAGIGFGASVDLEPVVFNASIEIGKFEVSENAAMPDFEADMQLRSGIKLNAEVAPYLGVCIDAKIAAAGLKVVGSAKAEAAADLNMAGKLHGGQDGFWGELSMGLELNASASIEVILRGYAEALGKSFEHDFTKWTFDLGDIFSIKWGKKFTFGDKEETADSDESVTPVPAQSEKVQAEEESDKSYFASKFPKAAPSPKKDKAPNLGDPSQDAKDKADEKGDGAASGPMEKMQKAGDLASAIGAIAKFIGIISDAVIAASIAGPIGVFGYFAFQFATGKLSFDGFKEDIAAIKKGIDAARELLKDVDLLKLILPEKVYDFYMEFKDLTFDQILDKAVEAIEKAIKSLGPAWADILAPVVTFARKQKEKLQKVIEIIQQGISIPNMVKVLFEVLNLSVTSIIDFIKMIGGCLSNLKKLIDHCIKEGGIKVGPRYWKGKIPPIPHRKWKFEIPGIISESGDDVVVARLILSLLGVKEDKSFT